MKKTATVSVDFVITVRVPIDTDFLPNDVHEGDTYDGADLPDETVEKILDAVEYYTGERREAEEMETVEIDGIEETDDEEETDDIDYDNSPEYIHDAALDWFYEHSGDYYEEDMEDGTMLADCMDALSDEGYNVHDLEGKVAVEDALDDFMADR